MFLEIVRRFFFLFPAVELEKGDSRLIGVGGALDGLAVDEKDRVRFKGVDALLENDEERESCDSGVLGRPARKDEHIRARATLATENSWELCLATASVSALFFCIYFTTAWERANRSRPFKSWGMFSTLFMFVCLSEKVDREQEQIEK